MIEAKDNLWRVIWTNQAGFSATREATPAEILRAAADILAEMSTARKQVYGCDNLKEQLRTIAGAFEVGLK